MEPPEFASTSLGSQAPSEPPATVEPADELAALRTQLRESEQQLARMPALEQEALLAVADRRELDALRERVEVLEAELQRARSYEPALERASRAIDQMEHSLSWRLSAPLRAVKRAVDRRGRAA